MTMRGSWIWLVEIEGLGRSGITTGGAYLPMALTTEPDPGDAAFPGGSAAQRSTDIWQPVLQPGSVKLSGQSFSPFANKPAAQTLSFDLALPDALPEIADFFLSRPDPIAVLTATVAASDTTISMTDTSAITAGDVIYIGAECFRVQTVNSGTQVTVVNSIPDSVIWPQSKRANADNKSVGTVGRIGQIGSRIARHEIPTANEAPPLPDDRVYLFNPRVRARRVYLRRVSWGLDETGAEGYREQLIGQYLINDITINADSTTVSVSASSYVASYADDQIGARGVADRGIGAVQSATLSVLYVDFDPASDAYDRRIWKGSCAAYAADSEGYFVVGMDRSVDVGGAETVGIGVLTSRRLGLKATTSRLATGDQLDLLASGDDSVGKALKEVLLSDPLLIPRDTTGEEVLSPPVPTEHPYYSLDKPGGAGILTNPLHMVLAHLGQFRSNLPFHWQLRMDTTAVATDNILALAERLVVPEWPGVCATGPQKGMEWIAETFLRPIGCGWIVDEYGRLDIGSLTTPRFSPWAIPNVQTGSDTITSIGVAAVMPGRQVQRIVDAEAGVTQANIGQGLGKTPRLTIQSADAYRVADGDPESSTFILNAMGAMSPDDTVDNLIALDLPAVSFVRTITSTVGTYLRAGAIQYTLTVPSSYPAEDEAYQPSLSLGPAMPSRYAVPGSAVIVEDIPGLRKPPGPRLCVVLGHQWQDNCTTQQLRVLDLGGTVRIAAAGRVVSASVVSGSLEIVLEPDFEVKPTPYSTPPFGDITEDGETLAAFAMTVGDYEYVRFFDATLAEQNPGPGNAEQVTFYDPATNTLTTTFIGSYTPAAGDFVLLSDGSDVDDYFAFFGRDRFTI